MSSYPSSFTCFHFLSIPCRTSMIGSGVVMLGSGKKASGLSQIVLYGTFKISQSTICPPKELSNLWQAKFSLIRMKESHTDLVKLDWDQTTKQVSIIFDSSFPISVLWELNEEHAPLAEFNLSFSFSFTPFGYWPESGLRYPCKLWKGSYLKISKNWGFCYKVSAPRGIHPSGLNIIKNFNF